MGMACLEAAGINGELDGDCEELRLDLGFRGWGKQRGSRETGQSERGSRGASRGPLVQRGAGGAASRPTERHGGCGMATGKERKRRETGSRVHTPGFEPLLHFLFLILKQQVLAI